MTKGAAGRWVVLLVKWWGRIRTSYRQALGTCSLEHKTEKDSHCFATENKNIYFLILRKNKISLSNYLSPVSPSLIQSVFFHLEPNEHDPVVLAEELVGIQLVHLPCY